MCGVLGSTVGWLDGWMDGWMDGSNGVCDGLAAHLPSFYPAYPTNLLTLLDGVDQYISNETLITFSSLSLAHSLSLCSTHDVSSVTDDFGYRTLHYDV